MSELERWSESGGYLPDLSEEDVYDHSPEEEDEVI